MNAIYNAAIGSQYGINFRDITTGNNGNCAICNAKPGYDFVTGLGSPITNNLNPFLSPSPPLPPHSFSETLSMSDAVSMHKTSSSTSNSEPLGLSDTVAITKT